MNMPTSKLENTCETTAVVAVAQTAALLRLTGKKSSGKFQFEFSSISLENTVKQVKLQLIWFGWSFHIYLGDLVFKVPKL